MFDWITGSFLWRLQISCFNNRLCFLNFRFEADLDIIMDVLVSRIRI
jgi:hypothetical protein